MSFHIEKNIKQDKKEEEEKWVKNVLKGTIDKYNLHELSQSKKSIQYTGANKNIFSIIFNSTQYTDWYYFRYTDTAVFLAKSLNKSMAESKEAEKITNSSDL